MTWKEVLAQWIEDEKLHRWADFSGGKQQARAGWYVSGAALMYAASDNREWYCYIIGDGCLVPADLLRWVEAGCPQRQMANPKFFADLKPVLKAIMMVAEWAGAAAKYNHTATARSLFMQKTELYHRGPSI